MCEWRAAADQGHLHAQCFLGKTYDQGCGVAQSDAEAVRWFRKAADQGDASAQNSLGQILVIGRGLAQSSVEAAR